MAQDDKTFNLHSFFQRFPDEKACREHLKRERFPDGKVVCPKCATFNKIYELKDGNRYKCGECKHIFTITVGTIFEGSHVPLQKWFLALYIISAHKKGISSLQLHRDIGVTQKTAWFMLHRIRQMLAVNTKHILSGEVEMDEVYIGPKKRFMNPADIKKRIRRYPIYRGNIPVVGMVQRGGSVITIPIRHLEKDAINDLIQMHVKEGTTLYTDESKLYLNVPVEYMHKVIVHEKAHAIGRTHTNTIEGYWSLLRRGIIGIYHYVSVKHLHRYCDEFQYRYNTRKMIDANRFWNSLAICEGRLRYKTLIGK